MSDIRIGLIARDDCGGLGAQSIEFAENLPIAATMVVKLGERGRGPSFDYPWPDATYVNGPRIDDVMAVQLFLNKVDVVLSIETFYGPMVIDLATQRGIPTVRYANPELYKDEEQSHVVLPTEWEKDRISQATVIPQGVSKQQHARIRTGPAKTLLHFSTPAMMDRNGTADFHSALNMTQQSFKVIVVGPSVRRHERSLKHEWIEVTHYEPNRMAHYTNDIDLLVLPRRYGGLSLPMLEAASFGIPTLASDLVPQNGWFGSDALISTQGRDMVNMVGGSFWVYSIYANQLAERLDVLAKGDLATLSRGAKGFADDHSWERITPKWLDYFANILA